ncbi:HPr kinase/phosphorylase [Dirofilaria immitis]
MLTIGVPSAGNSKYLEGINIVMDFNKSAIIIRLGLSVKALPIIPIRISIQQPTLFSSVTTTLAVDSAEIDFEWRRIGVR